MKVNLSFWRPKFLKARGSIKRSPIEENSLCPFSPMQHWSVYLTMSHESNWHPSEWTISVCFDSETAEWSSGEEVGPVLLDEWWVLFNTSKNIENQEHGERMIWHQSICQNSKHSRVAENTVLLDAKKFLVDIDSITLNATSTNLSDHLAGYKKLKLYDECCDQRLLSGEPNSAYIEIPSRGGLKNRSTRTMLHGTVTKAFFLFDASSNVIRRSALDSKSAGIVILQKFFDSPTILWHNQRDEFIFHLIHTIYNCFFSAQTKTLTKLQLSKIK